MRENGIPFSKKIQNYETFWLMSPSFQDESDYHLLLSKMDDTYSYIANDRTVKFRIEREKNISPHNERSKSRIACMTFKTIKFVDGCMGGHFEDVETKEKVSIKGLTSITIGDTSFETKFRTINGSDDNHGHTYTKI